MLVRCDNVTQTPRLKCVNYIDMRKNGSRLLSINQYRFTDLFLFAVIMAIAEIAAHYAVVWFPAGATFALSFVVPICLIAMLRWGWQSIVLAVLSGILYCAFNDGSLTDYIVYIVGNSFVLLALIPLSLVGKHRFTDKWYMLLLLVAIAWLGVYLGRSVVFAICLAVSPVEGVAPYSGFVSFAAGDLLSLVMSVIIMIGLRKFDGMLEDQVTYLKRLNKARTEKRLSEKFDENTYTELDEEALSILNQENDIY